MWRDGVRTAQAVCEAVPARHLRSGRATIYPFFRELVRPLRDHRSPNSSQGRGNRARDGIPRELESLVLNERQFHGRLGASSAYAVGAQRWTDRRRDRTCHPRAKRCLHDLERSGFIPVRAALLRRDTCRPWVRPRLLGALEFCAHRRTSGREGAEGRSSPNGRSARQSSMRSSSLRTTLSNGEGRNSSAAPRPRRSPRTADT